MDYSTLRLVPLRSGSSQNGELIIHSLVVPRPLASLSRPLRVCRVDLADFRFLAPINPDRGGLTGLKNLSYITSTNQNHPRPLDL